MYTMAQWGGRDLSVLQQGKKRDASTERPWLELSKATRRGNGWSYSEGLEAGSEESALKNCNKRCMIQ